MILKVRQRGDSTMSAVRQRALVLRPLFILIPQIILIPLFTLEVVKVLIGKPAIC